MKAYLKELPIIVNYIDHDEAEEEFTKRQIKAVPHIIFVKNGLEVEVMNGFVPEEKLKELYEAL